MQSLDSRFGAIEKEQRDQRGLLEQIAAKLGGGGGSGSATTGTAATAPVPATAVPGDMAEQMRQAVRDVRAEEAAADADEQHAADHERLRHPPAEQAPREVMVKGKAALQRRLFGADR